jgi:hypothetical protein
MSFVFNAAHHFQRHPPPATTVGLQYKAWPTQPQ